MPPSTTTTAPSTPHPQITAINLRALQRSDPSITRIVAQTAYVVAYREEEADVGGRGQGQADARGGGETGVKWEKMGVEGSLFVYESSTPPHSGILILNRNGIHNYQKPVIPLYTDISVDGSWVYLCGVDMSDLAGLLPRSTVLESGTQTQTQTPTPTPTVIGDNSSRRTNNRRARTTKSSQSPQRTVAATSNNNPAPASSAGVNPNPTVIVKKTRVALYCHHGTESQGSEEARRLSGVLKSICISSDSPALQAQPQTLQPRGVQELTQSNPNQHPGIAQTTSAPAVPTVSSSPLPQQSQTNTQPQLQQTQESSGMSMSALLSKLSQTASPAPANTVSQPFPGPPTSGPNPGFPPMNGGQHLYPANGGVPDMLHHSNSWSVGQIPSPHLHPHSHHMGTTSPQRAPVYPHQMGGIASPRLPNQPSGTHDAADLTASLKQMLGLGAASSPNRGPSDGNVSNAMTPGAHRNGPAQHPMTPTRRFDDPQSFQHGATPPPIHLAPALNTMSGRSRSPLQMPSVQQSTLSGNSFQPPSRHNSQRQVQTNSPHNTFTSSATQARLPHHGYVPNPNRNGDPFTIGTSSGDAGVHTINKNGVAHAVVDTWNKSTHKDGLMEENGAPNEDDKEQKRDFVRGLLSAIHTDESFVNQLWKKYCDSQRGRKGGG